MKITTTAFSVLFVPAIQALVTLRPSILASKVSSSSPLRLFASTDRKPFITGNWKMNPKTKQEAIELASGIADAVTRESPGDVAIFVPYPFIECVQKAVGEKLLVGAEVSF
jgi:triosephosphate isomerase (TIM)